MTLRSFFAAHGRWRVTFRPAATFIAACLLACGAPHAAFAQGYPAKPVRLVVPFPSGSPSDILGRIVGQELGTALGQPVVIDNRPGAAGVIGVDTAAKAAPDGYTLLMGGTGALAINPAMRTTMPYDPLRDFAPVSLVAAIPFILVTSSALPANTVKELVAFARTQPRPLHYASSGVGSPPHLAAELFRGMTGIELTHVPYKGTGPATTDLISGQVQLIFSGITVLLPYVKAGKLKCLAVASNSRTALLPAVPTVIESGLAGFTAETWTGVLAPARTATLIVNRLNGEVVKMLHAPDVRDRLAALGAEAVGNSPAQFSAYIRDEMSKWARVVKAAGVREE